MRVWVVVVAWWSLLAGGRSSDDRRWLLSLVDLVELDYEDHCDQRAAAAWDHARDHGKLSIKIERDKAFGLFARAQTGDVRSSLKEHVAADDDALARKLSLVLLPGDTLLATDDWFKLVTFGDNAAHALRAARDYYCSPTHTNCTLQELQLALSQRPAPEWVRRMRLSWERHLPSMHDYLDQILPLLNNAAKENNYKSVEEYWDSLAEYEGALVKARELWGSVRPLYRKLAALVAASTAAADSEAEGTLTLDALRSLNGEDWTNVMDKVLPKHPDIYVKITENLKLKGIGGAAAFRDAADLVRHLQLGDLESHIFSESIFNSTCPPTVVDWCKPSKLRVATCSDVSLTNYLDAFETVMSIKHKELAALHSNNTYLFREAARYSAIYEAIPGFASLLALNPYTLNRMGLYPYERFSYNPNHHRLVLQMFMALRDLPRLNYYLAVDEWRLNVLKGVIPASQAADSWSEFRKNFSLIETSDVDFLGDPYVLFNKPYIGKFMGLILKYQVYQSFAEELQSDESDLTQQVADNSNRLSDAMMQGYGAIWPDLVSDLLAKRENGLEYTGLTDYYRLLDEYLDRRLDPTDDGAGDDYIEPALPDVPPPPEISSPEDNEIPVEEDKKPDTTTPRPDDHENMIATDDKLSKESTTESVLEVKNQIVSTKSEKEDSTVQASYSTYWWIGVIAAVAVVLVLVALIARKRRSHRRQIEKQRREDTRA